jgi:hypothetical protein
VSAEKQPLPYARANARRRVRRRWLVAGVIALFLVPGAWWLPGVYRAWERRVFNIRRSQRAPIDWWRVLTSSELRQLAWSLSEQPYDAEWRFRYERDALPDVWCFGTLLSDASVSLVSARVSRADLHITLAVENWAQETLLIPGMSEEYRYRRSAYCFASYGAFELLSADVVLVPPKEFGLVTVTIPLVPDVQQAGAELQCGTARVDVRVVPPGGTIGLDEREIPRSWVSIRYWEGPGGLDLISAGELETLMNSPASEDAEGPADQRP